VPRQRLSCFHYHPPKEPLARFRRPVHCARFERPQRQPTVRRTSHRGDRRARRRKAIPSSRAAIPTGLTDSTRQESSRPSNGQNAIDLCPFRHSTQSVAAREPTAACPGNPRSALLVSARGRTAPGAGGSVSAVSPGENMLSLPSGRYAARSHRACGQPPQSEPRRCPPPPQISGCLVCTRLFTVPSGLPCRVPPGC
jgi:hypothetical protein